MSKKSSVKVSVILPYHNEDPEMLERAIRSVTKQAFKETEILVINDGSDHCFDDSLKKICKKDKRIKLLEQENKGVSSARNHGIREASGEYMIFLDADDELTDQSISEAYHIAKKYNADMLIGGTQIIEKNTEPSIRNDKISVVRIDKKNKSKYKSALAGKMMYFYDDIYINRGIAARFVKSIIARETLFNEQVKIAEDLLFTLDVYMKSTNVFIVKDLWYLYHNIEGSATHKYNDTLDKDTALHLKKIRKYFDLDNREECEAFSARVFYCLNFVGRYKFFHKDRKCDPVKNIAGLLKLYDTYPWSILKDKRCMKAAKGVDRALLMAFRLKLYYLIYFMKIKIKG